MSTATTKPKVFRVPAAKPVPTKRLFARGYERITRDRSVLALVAVVALIVVGLSVQHPKAAKEQSGMGAIDKENFTFDGSASERVAKDSQTFVIRDENTKIVGRLAEISGQEKELKQIKATTDVDNEVNGDLLSVVNKH